MAGTRNLAFLESHGVDVFRLMAMLIHLDQQTKPGAAKEKLWRLGWKHGTSGRSWFCVKDNDSRLFENECEASWRVRSLNVNAAYYCALVTLSKIAPLEIQSQCCISRLVMR